MRSSVKEGEASFGGRPAGRLRRPLCATHPQHRGSRSIGGRATVVPIHLVRARYAQGVFDRITFDQKVMSGRACVRGTRVPMSVIVSQVTPGATYGKISTASARSRPGWRPHFSLDSFVHGASARVGDGLRMPL